MRIFPKIDVDLILFTLFFVSEVTRAKDVKISRRILEGDFVNEGFHFMVYLTTSSDPNLPHNWLCGGVIIHEEFILTSAACISYVDYFYVIAGTYTFYDIHHQNVNRCVRNTIRRAVWKCVPKEYDYHESWSANDIAVVKVEKPYDIGYKSPGCYFAPRIITFNNISKDYETRGRTLTTAGWGSVDKYVPVTMDNKEESPENSRRLLAVNVTVIQNKRCRESWDQELESSIKKFMICTGTPWAPPPESLQQHVESSPDAPFELSQAEICEAMGMRCQKLEPRIDVRTSLSNSSTNYVHHDSDEIIQRFIQEEGLRKRLQEDYEVPGICQNDHGGPLLGTTTKGEFVVVGIISAFLRGTDNRCTEPFLYTSVFYNRQFISCAVGKELKPWSRKYWSNGTLDGCRKPTTRRGDMFNEKRISWRLHPDGPSENEKIEDLEIAVKKYFKISSL